MFSNAATIGPNEISKTDKIFIDKCLKIYCIFACCVYYTDLSERWILIIFTTLK